MTFRFSEDADRRVMTAYQRLPRWQQNALSPLMMSGYVATLWPTPILIGSVTMLYAYLKVHFFPDLISWGRLGWMATAPIWFPLAFGYPFLLWVGIGTIPYALIVGRRQRWEGRPFALHDPAMTLVDETRARLEQGKLLTAGDIWAIKIRSDHENVQILLCLKITGTSLLIASVILLVIWLFFAHIVALDTCIWVAILGCVATMPFALTGGDSPELWCGNCRRRIFNANLQHLIETWTCPHCSSPAKVVGRQPGRMSGSLWDADVP